VNSSGAPIDNSFWLRAGAGAGAGMTMFCGEVLSAGEHLYNTNTTTQQTNNLNRRSKVLLRATKVSVDV